MENLEKIVCKPACSWRFSLQPSFQIVIRSCSDRSSLKIIQITQRKLNYVNSLRAHVLTKSCDTVAAGLRSLRTDDRLSKGHPRSLN